jgi:hypothetical protein
MRRPWLTMGWCAMGEKNNSLRSNSMYNLSCGCAGIAVYREMAIELNLIINPYPANVENMVSS